MHLREISQSHLETRFISINVEKAPFFVQKLEVKVLPTIVCFNDGKAVQHIIGLDALGGREDFKTMDLIRLLIDQGVLKAINRAEEGRVNLKLGKGGKKKGGGPRRGEKDYANDSDEDDY